MRLTKRNDLKISQDDLDLSLIEVILRINQNIIYLEYVIFKKRKSGHYAFVKSSLVQ